MCERVLLRTPYPYEGRVCWMFGTAPRDVEEARSLGYRVVNGWAEERLDTVEAIRCRLWNGEAVYV